MLGLQGLQAHRAIKEMSALRVHKGFKAYREFRAKQGLRVRRALHRLVR